MLSSGGASPPAHRQVDSFCGSVEESLLSLGGKSMTLPESGGWSGSEMRDIMNSCQSTLGKLRGIRGIAIF